MGMPSSHCGRGTTGSTNGQHHSLRKFYFECSNLKYLTALINVPELGANPPNPAGQRAGGRAAQVADDGGKGSGTDARPPPRRRRRLAQR